LEEHFTELKRREWARMEDVIENQNGPPIITDCGFERAWECRNLFSGG
jgi:hypothetical protein